MKQVLVANPCCWLPMRQVNFDKEAWFYVKDGNMIRNDHKTGETAEMVGKSGDLSRDMVTDMTNAGMLASGSMPSFEVEKEEAQKAVMEKLTGEPVIAHKKKGTKRGATEPAEPRSYQQQAEDKMADILKDGTKARELALALTSNQYGEKLCKELWNFNGQMEKLFQKLQAIVNSGSTRRSAYKAYLSFADEKKKWFENAQAWPTQYLPV